MLLASDEERATPQGVGPPHFGREDDDAQLPCWSREQIAGVLGTWLVKLGRTTTSSRTARSKPRPRRPWLGVACAQEGLRPVWPTARRFDSTLLSPALLRAPPPHLTSLASCHPAAGAALGLDLLAVLLLALARFRFRERCCHLQPHGGGLPCAQPQPLLVRPPQHPGSTHSSWATWVRMRHLETWRFGTSWAGR